MEGDRLPVFSSTPSNQWSCGIHCSECVVMYCILICFVYFLITAIVAAVFAGISSGWVMAVVAFFGYALLQLMLS